MHKLIENHYRENFGKLVKIFANRAGGAYNSEDVVQEAFERAIRYQNSFDPERQEFGGWFNGIINNSLREFKIAERRLGMGVEYNEDMDDVIPLMEWEEDLIENVKEDIAKKPEAVRQALYLYIFQQYKPREIAQIVDMSNAYIRTSVKEFKQEMRKKYGEVV